MSFQVGSVFQFGLLPSSPICSALHVRPRGAEEDDSLVLLAFLAFTALPAAAGRRLSAAELHLVQGLSQGVAEGGLCRVNWSNFNFFSFLT